MKGVARDQLAREDFYPAPHSPRSTPAAISLSYKTLEEPYVTAPDSILCCADLTES